MQQVEQHPGTRAQQASPDPIAECHRLGITIRVDAADTVAALDAWETADDAEVARVIAACLETQPDLHKIVEPFAVRRLARESAARYALAANRRMSLGEAA